MIYRNGALFGAYSSKNNCRINVDGCLTVVVENGEVYVCDARCDDKLCEKQGRLSAFPIVCLPQRIEIKREEARGVMDGVVY